MNNIKYKKTKDIEKIDNLLVSVIIRTRNEERYIEECIKRINSQKCNFNYEIIIIDSESDDKTIYIAKKYNVSIIEINKTDFNFGTSINLGINLSEAKYCVFVSAHALPIDEYWLVNLVKSCQGDNVVASYSKQLYDKSANVIEARGLESKFGDVQKIQSFDKFIKKNGRKPNKFFEYRKDITFSNASSCIKKDVAKKIPFKEIIASEDREWSLRALNAGYKIIYEPQSKILHYHNEDIKSWYKRIYINSVALKEFSGYTFKKYLTIPIIFVNTIRDLKFVYKNKRDGFGLKQIKISLIYWKYYCKAFFDASNN